MIDAKRLYLMKPKLYGPSGEGGILGATGTAAQSAITNGATIASSAGANVDSLWGQITESPGAKMLASGVDTVKGGVSSLIDKLPTGASLSTFGENAKTVLSTGVSSLGTSAAETASKIGEAFSDSKGFVKDKSDQNKESLTPTPWQADKSQNDLFAMGRPCRFNQTIDPQRRFGNYLRSKMSVIDLIPVDYGVDFTRMADMITKDKGTLSEGIYSLGYEIKIKLYKALCDYHGLKPYAGVRLYTTDDTTASDTIQVQYKDSTFQGLTDKMTEFGQGFRNVTQSVLGEAKSNEFVDSTQGTIHNTTKKLSAEFGATSGLSELLAGISNVASDMVMSGNKMTFPKIWQSSSYNGNLSVNVRLISPYGHPKAIKEFIMKPLSYLLLLAAPQTVNGITYGGSIPVTIKAYGLNYTIVGSLASITFRRGGSDSSFNLYRQPLTLDLSLEFQTLFDAFAVYDPSVLGKKLKADKKVFWNENLSDPGPLNMYNHENNNNLMTTLGTILASFRPVKVTDMNVNPQVYGMFVPPSRSDIPDAPSFTPFTGNLGSAISGAVSNIGTFASLITNAPKLIQQGLANAVYNVAKGTVSTIAGNASKWISKTPAEAANIANKMTENFS